MVRRVLIYLVGPIVEAITKPGSAVIRGLGGLNTSRICLEGERVSSCRDLDQLVCSDDGAVTLNGAL